ncbi:efflux RND transporter periplasmic adaptor subunit [Shewanella sp. YIC-542]|uniref:efflux RND transporter periplasmic adaptor subunit n=1 Tax=Shewanella mytili TaxID=3377111 RepID=UPI00398F209C
MRIFKLSLSLVLLLLSTPLLADEEHATPSSESAVFQQGPVTVSLHLEEQSQGAYLWVKVSQQQQLATPTSLSAELMRVGRAPVSIQFEQQRDQWRSRTPISEPHSFALTIQMTLDNKHYQWPWQRYENSTEIDANYAEKAGITSAIATAGIIEQHVTLLGRLVVPPRNKASVSARFPGVITALNADIGQQVAVGQPLAQVEANESLQRYAVKAPISGVILQRMANIGEATNQNAIYEIVDTTTLWAELKVFPSQRMEIKRGMPIHIERQQQRVEGLVQQIIPSSNNQPFTLAIVEISNTTSQLSPGDLVTGLADAERVTVPVRVENRAIQTLDGQPVVFIQQQNRYQAMPVELGRADDQYTEIIAGLLAGDRYVVDNSYLIKADIEKSGAAHSH